MQIESLKVFCDLVDTGSFSQAAARNSISQSAVSQQVRALEDRFGKQLIERNRRGVVPTPAGIAFYEGCREILENVAALADDLGRTGKSVRGSVRVATIYSVGLQELQPLVKEFILSYPEVNIHVEYSRTNRIYEDLISGTIDLGIVAYPVARPQIEIIPFRDDPMVVICGPEYSLAGRKQIELQQLADERFVGFERDIPTRKAVDEILRDNGVIPRYAMEFDNIETIKRSVEVGQGIALVPLVTVQNEVRGGSLVVVKIQPEFSRPAAIIHRKGRVFSAATRKFVELLTGAPRQPQ
jgi:DNA-binding transcriptional LysR family regulator